jgi:hypothetical protein
MASADLVKLVRKPLRISTRGAHKLEAPHLEGDISSAMSSPVADTKSAKYISGRSPRNAS